MDMPQRQILQPRVPHLLGGNGAVGGVLAGGVAVEHGDAVFFAALRMEILQQRGAVHALVARAVDLAIQLRNRDGFQPAGEHVHILRPAFFQPEGAGGAEIMIARRDEDPCAAFRQRFLEDFHRLPGELAVKNISRQEQKIALFPAAKLGSFAGDAQLLLPQKRPLTVIEACEGGV